MFETSLARAVQQFASLMLPVPDPELDTEWVWGAYDSEGVRFAFFRTYEELSELAARTVAERTVRSLGPSATHWILAQYHAAYRDLQAVLLGLGPDEVEQAPAEGEWPVRRVVAHIVGADLGFYVAVRYALDRYRTGDERPAEIPDEAWDALLGQEVSSIEAILDGPLPGIQAYHQALHERVLNEYAGISEEELAAPSTYWEGQAMSLRFRLHRFDSHLRQHIVQIEKIRAAIGRPPTETGRLLRLLYSALAGAEGATIGAWDVGAEWREGMAGAISARADEIAEILAG
jgi:uncharacterized damage-inducible protein DinB